MSYEHTARFIQEYWEDPILPEITNWFISQLYTLLALVIPLEERLGEFKSALEVARLLGIDDLFINTQLDEIYQTWEESEDFILEPYVFQTFKKELKI